MRKRPLGLLLALVLLGLTPLPIGASQEPPEPPGLELLTGPNAGDPDDIAVDYLRAEAAGYGLSASDVSDLAIRSSYTSKHNGVTHVNINQQFQGLEVFGADTTVNIAKDGSVLFVAGSSVSGLATASGAADNDAAEAVEAAADAIGLDEPSSLRVLSSSAEESLVSSGGISDATIPAKLGWQPTDSGLRKAWQVVIDESGDSHLWNATVDAETGDLLDLDDWTTHDNIADLASTLARPAASMNTAAFVFQGSPTVVTPTPVNDGSGYTVYALPKETPNDGPRSLVSNPADAATSPFGWHDTDGVAGPEYTVTRGNNVHAYTDRDANGDPDPGSDPDGGGGLDFNFPLDLTEHPQNYFDATVTNLFYWNNTFHDIAARYGFDEASGNFQVTNYSGDGSGGDDVRGEAADGNGHNNANFSTPAADGGRPRMQMYLWPGSTTLFGQPNTVTIDSGAAAGTYQAQYARFTPAPTNAGLSGTIVLANDGVGNPNDGCTAYAVPAGSIVVVDNPDDDDCDNDEQVATAEAAGAAAVVVADDSGTNPSTMSGSMEPPVGIPAVQVSTADGAIIKAALPVAGSVEKSAAHPGIRDGDLEAGIIIHEYGHGVSNRLTGGPGVNCLSGDERMGEGWSDYLAIALLIDPLLDDPQGPRGMGPYALFQDDRQGNGIRPRPYSRDMNIQPFTYDMIKTNGWITGGSLATPHGVGHAWAATLWDMTWDLIDVHGFNPQVYDDWSTGGNNLAYQLVMDGMKLQGCGPGFVVGRAAIVAADVALTGGENYCTLWRTFARRGLGISAIQGTTDRNDNTQAFDIPADCVRGQSRVNLNGANVPSAWQVPGAGDPDATAGLRLTWKQNGQVCATPFQLKGVSAASITSMTINYGGHGEPDGPVVIDMDLPPGGPPAACVAGVDAALLDDIRTQPSRYYVVINTVDYPNGALRGQLN